jgi:hypothetical protein
MTTPPATVTDSTKPIYAALGAGDAVVQAATDIVTKAQEQVASLQLRDKVSIDELRRLIDEYKTVALDRYTEFAERGVAAADKLRPTVEENIDRVETLYKDVVARAEDADLFERNKPPLFASEQGRFAFRLVRRSDRPRVRCSRATYPGARRIMSAASSSLLGAEGLPSKAIRSRNRRRPSRPGRAPRAPQRCRRRVASATRFRRWTPE